ncbi:MAG: hypothetical protein IPP29_09755 [Bacteroidetes bacterium]|nr:hypothetical protein [Bacteroidota bacterium]
MKIGLSQILVTQKVVQGQAKQLASSAGFIYPLCAAAKYITGNDYSSGVNLDITTTLSPIGYIYGLHMNISYNNMAKVWEDIPSQVGHTNLGWY